MEPVKPDRDRDGEDAFWRKLTLPQEDRLAAGLSWKGGYRWFRSANVIPIEQHRRRKARSSDGDDNAA
jgi:hypothetical protein